MKSFFTVKRSWWVFPIFRSLGNIDSIRVNAVPVEVWGVLVYCWHRPLAHPIFTILYKELIHSPPTTDWLRTGFWILQIFKPKFCNSPELEPQISMNAQHRPPGARLYFPFSSKIPEAVEWFSSLQCPKSRHANYVWQYLEAAFLWIIHTILRERLLQNGISLYQKDLLTRCLKTPVVSSRHSNITTRSATKLFIFQVSWMIIKKSSYSSGFPTLSNISYMSA